MSGWSPAMPYGGDWPLVLADLVEFATNSMAEKRCGAPTGTECAWAIDGEIACSLSLLRLVIDVLKPGKNPPLLPTGVATLAELNGPWWIAHTKSRFEKAFAFDLLRRGIGYFLPMGERTKISGGKKRRLMLPLFPSYVFFCGGAEQRYAALATDRLCRVIEVVDQAGLLRDLLSLQEALARNALLDPYPFAAVGSYYRVSAGPFQGLEGVLVQKLGPSRLILQVKMLGQGAAMEIDAALLEPVDERISVGRAV